MKLIRCIVAAAAGLTILVVIGQGEELAPGKGKAIVQAACTDCHGPEAIFGRTWSKAKWSDTVKNMQSLGAVLSDEEFDIVVDYLTTNYGEKPAH